MAKNRVALKSLKHDEATKKNLPTIENEGFVPESIKVPKEVDYPRASLTLYPRNAAADPQLVWRGKDAQDADGDLAIKALPIYVHEHITPLKIVQSLIDESQGRSMEPELFEQDFNGLTEEQRLRFYEYDEHWTNRLILGDSLAVMASLDEKEKLRGRVQMIYMDPPYGVDFKSNWQVLTNKRDVKNGKAEDLSTEPEQIRAYRDTWKDGIHSYLSYLRDRVTAAHDLLNPRGSIFIQISDDNVHLVRSLLDEVFGDKNCMATVVFEKTSGASSDELASTVDFLLWYARDASQVKYRQLFRKKKIGEEGTTQYVWVQSPDGEVERRMTPQEIDDPGIIPKGWKIFACDNLTSQRPPQGADVRSFVFKGQEFLAGKGTFKTDLHGLENLTRANRLKPIGKTLMYKRFLDDFPVSPLANLWRDVKMTGFSEDKLYVVQTSSKVIERCVLMTTDPGDLVLDPTCGSGTTAWCAEKWGRRWITIDTSRVALMLARQRMMTSRYPYYLLLDSHEGRIEESRRSGMPSDPAAPAPRGNVKKGFVYDRVPHVQLRAIANNPDLAAGLTQNEIDAVLRRSTETEALVDRPIENKAFVRVSGPFTVESQAPTESASIDADSGGKAATDRGDFVALILDNLQTSGISNGETGGRTRFLSVEPFPGEYVDAIGMTDDGQRFAIAIGPSDGTIGKRFMIDAGREALDEVAADALAVCGFAFEDAAQTERIGRLMVLKVRMNQDLQIADLLKKSKSANLFQVYGEPDVEIETEGDALRVKVSGMDVFDPGKRELRSAGTDRIQAWFLDTDYDGERFIVRHAYFLGDQEVFADLRRALKGEIDAEGWQSLYSDVSRPFSKPRSGKIAVKVITVYGDEAVVVRKA